MDKPHYKLVCWKESFQVSVDIYKFTKLFPSEEKFGIISQLRRASSSIPANIAEVAARQSSKEFIQFLYISLGSLSELDTFLLLCMELEYLDREIGNSYLEKLDHIGKLITGLIKKLKTS
jgi:four helix bundle protein